MNSQTTKDIGYLILRLGLGILTARHGWPMLVGGAEKWESVGSFASAIGITFYPVVWGFVAAAAEVVGGICVAVGFLFRPACILITATLIGALTYKLQDASTFGYWIEYAEMATAFFAMFLMGPGRFSLSVSMNK
ncbi:MAG: DoxX family protein [Chitinophagales bacterium]|jgi:putative oxidoreductase|nr:DoxX family protein [Bacteroidota bacterium]MBX7139476.1 DoxX family protein [Chitinophagales bacterium]